MHKPDLNPECRNCLERLAEYYKNKGNVEKTKEIIFQLGNTFEYNEENGSAIQLSSKLQHLYKIYSTYGLIDKANAVLIRLRETGPKINKELNHNSFSFEIPEEKLDAFINFMIDGTLIIFYIRLYNTLYLRRMRLKIEFMLAKQPL